MFKDIFTSFIVTYLFKYASTLVSEQPKRTNLKDRGIILLETASHSSRNQLPLN